MPNALGYHWVMTQTKKKSSNGHFGFAVGLVVGTILGATGAILLTPSSGEETRHRLQRKFGPQPGVEPLSSDGIKVL